MPADGIMVGVSCLARTLYRAEMVKHEKWRNIGLGPERRREGLHNCETLIASRIGLLGK
jgi:hypothetical protein